MYGRKCEAAVAVSRARAVQSKCRKLVTHLESQLKEAVGCEREAESHLAACVAEMAAAVAEEEEIKEEAGGGGGGAGGGGGGGRAGW